ncbi:MAG: phosphonoacetaldehyde hydrolase [Halanaerobiales bacterium]
MNNDQKIKAVIFDWAGTMVDYGCFAPLDVFISVFKNRGIDLTIKEARRPMGLKKIDHIKKILKMKRINKLWQKKYSEEPDEQDVINIYQEFKKKLLKILPDYSRPIPGALQLVDFLKSNDIKIGSSTGYTSDMMKVLVPAAARKGYQVDCLVTSSDVPGGRPYPWMCYQNALKLQIYPMYRIVKVGDTVNDIKAGINAGVWSVGVILGSSELGLSKEEVENSDPNRLKDKVAEVRKKYKEAGAHYVIDTISDLEDIINDINKKLPLLPPFPNWN